MKLRYWLFGLLILAELGSNGCMLFGHKDTCCGERRGMFSFLHRRKNVEGGVMMGGMECGSTCSTCGDVPGMAMSGGPMLAGPMGPPDERLGAPAAVNRPWDGQGAPPAQLPKTNPGAR